MAVNVTFLILWSFESLLHYVGLTVSQENIEFSLYWEKLSNFFYQSELDNDERIPQKHFVQYNSVQLQWPKRQLVR